MHNSVNAVDLLNWASNTNHFHMFGESDFGNDSIKYHQKHHISSVGRHLTKPLLNSIRKNALVTGIVACWAIVYSTEMYTQR